MAPSGVIAEGKNQVRIKGTMPLEDLEGLDQLSTELYVAQGLRGPGLEAASRIPCS